MSDINSNESSIARLVFTRDASQPLTNNHALITVTLSDAPKTLYHVHVDKTSRRARSRLPALRISRVRDDTNVPFAIIIFDDTNSFKASIEFSHGKSQTREVQVNLKPAQFAQLIEGVPVTGRAAASQTRPLMVELPGLMLNSSPGTTFAWQLTDLGKRRLSTTANTAADAVSTTPRSTSGAPPSSRMSTGRPAVIRDERALADRLDLTTIAARGEESQRFATYYNEYERGNGNYGDRSVGESGLGLGDQPGQTTGTIGERYGTLEVLAKLVDHEFTDHIVATLVAVLEVHMRIVKERKHGKGKTSMAAALSGCVVC